MGMKWISIALNGEMHSRGVMEIVSATSVKT